MVAADLPAPAVSPQGHLRGKLEDFGYGTREGLVPIIERLDCKALSLVEGLVNDLADATKTSQNLRVKVNEVSLELEQERLKEGELQKQTVQLVEDNSRLRAQLEECAAQNTHMDQSDERLLQWRTQSLHQLQELERMNQALRVTLSRQTSCCTASSDGTASTKQKPCGGYIELSHVLAPSNTFNSTSECHLQPSNSQREESQRLTEMSRENVEEEAQILKGKLKELQKILVIKVEDLKLQVIKLQSTVEEQECTIISLRAELAQKIEQLSFIVDEKAAGEEALGESQLECNQLASIMKELDEKLQQLTTALATRTLERDYAISAEKQETEAHKHAEEGLKTKCDTLMSDLQASQAQQVRMQLELDESKREEEETLAMHTQTLSELQKCQKQLQAVCKETEQMRSLITQLDITREELVEKLKLTIEDQHTAVGHAATLELELQKLAEDAQLRNIELTQLHAMLEALGKERDHLQNEIHMQGESLSCLKDENNQMMMEVRTLRRNLQNAEHKLHSESLLLQKAECEISMLRDKVASEEQCRKETEDQYAAKVMEIQSLAEGLRAVTSELQLTKSQVVQVSSERGTLMEDVKNLTSRLSYFEQLICTKDEEEKALSNSVEQLVDEHQQLKLAAIELDTQAQQQSYQLQNMEELLRNTKEQSTFFEEECKKLKLNFQKMERQANVLSQSLSQQTAVLDCVQKEKAALLAQISSSKQIILDLEKKNTSLMRELSTSESNSHLLSNILQGKIQEVESFTARYRFEHERVKELEQVLACSRAQEHQHQLECKDLSAKNAILQERLTALENQYTEENKVVNAICSHAHKSLHYHDVIDPADSKLAMIFDHAYERN